MFYIPYTDGKPAIININGHKLLLVTSDHKELEESLPLFGADSVVVVEESDIKELKDNTIEEIASLVEGGVVIAPEDVDLKQVVKDLAQELPWLQ